jgi:hypothetical protein
MEVQRKDKRMTRRPDVVLLRAAAVTLVSLALYAASGCGARQTTTTDASAPPTSSPPVEEPRATPSPPANPAVVPTAGRPEPTQPLRPAGNPEANVPGDGEAVFTEPSSGGTPKGTDTPSPQTAPAVAAAGAPGSSPPAKPGAISATTKRTAAGLPDAIQGYSSWFRLPPGAADAPAGPHLGERQAYIVLPEQENFSLGTTVKPPLGKGTMLILEQKEPGKDFISRIDHRSREEGGWKSASFTRTASDKPFAPLAANETECSGCHSKSEKDTVFSSLKLE